MKHNTNNRLTYRISQGDIFKDVPYLESYHDDNNGTCEIRIVTFPYVLVINQECDLEQNKNNRDKANTQEKTNSCSLIDKHLISILVLPLYNARQVIDGNHLDKLGIQSQIFNSKIKDNLFINKNERYHYLEFDLQTPIPPSIIDFKHFFTVSLDWLEAHLNSNRIASIDPLYREYVCQRFANFLSRIALP